MKKWVIVSSPDPFLACIGKGLMNTRIQSCSACISRIWGSLILHWLVVNDCTRSDDCRHYVTKPSPERDFECDAPKLVLSVLFQCCEQPAVDINNVFEGISKELTLDFKRWEWWLRDVMAAIVTPWVVIGGSSMGHLGQMPSPLLIKVLRLQSK